MVLKSFAPLIYVKLLMMIAIKGQLKITFVIIMRLRAFDFEILPSWESAHIGIFPCSIPRTFVILKVAWKPWRFCCSL